jgi:large subunit ribosomal protein L4e
MKSELIVRSIDGSVESTMPLPQVFQTPFRPEVIHRVYVNLLSHRFQRQGRYPAAGELVSAESRNTGLGIARLARIRGQGFSRAGQAAGVAGVRAGRIAHPPESWKVIRKKINKKERRLGLFSAIAATAQKDLIIGRGHRVGGIPDFPIVSSNNIESITKTRDLLKVLIAFGLADDLSRAGRPKKKASTYKGKGTRRAGTCALIVVRKGSSILKLSNSIAGVDIKSIESLSVLDLAPGSKPIRLTIFSRGSLDYLETSISQSNLESENKR